MSYNLSDFEKPYNPRETEEVIYNQWVESGFFNPDNLPGERTEPYTIILPPPNVTGTLHLGHAMYTVQDILVRFWRMRGKKALWLPGTDHAAIATQEKVEREIYKKEKKNRHDLGREEFLRRVETFAKDSHDTIVNQLKKMGFSLDWSREAYTLDEKRSYAVRTAFKRMYDAGLIYRGHRIVNWDPKMQSTVSDDELDYKDEAAPFYYLKYGPFVIGTARPETKFGDKYVVMHPDDERYAEYKDGQKINLEWINGPITATIIKDTAIDREFGTGVMTITPWHDATDFDIAERHNLDKEQIIDYYGKLLPGAGEEFAGMKIIPAREKIIEKLKEKGLVKKIDETYQHRIAINSRGGGTIEPQIMEQWFVDVNAPFKHEHSTMRNIPAGTETSLKKIMQTTVESKEIALVPDRFEKIYFNWINNLRDWCISRQIWFGHRIPVWYCEYSGSDKKISPLCAEPIVSIEEITACPHCKGTVHQDPDTLDTWFSSGLWTFSTLGWPEDTSDFQIYHPTNVLETGYDIIFFWVARMILMSGFHTGTIPFHTVYFHGLVRDSTGRKMSKSLGNSIDPLDMATLYGADATRLSLIIGNGPGNDLKMSEDKIRGYRNFANKIWNASRFVLSNIHDTNLSEKPPLTKEDERILEELHVFAREITSDIESYKLYLAAEKLYHYFWHTFADTIIEESKPRLAKKQSKDRDAAIWVLHEILETLLKLLHPFIPFVTEAIWRYMPKKDKELLLVETWPS
ncbi:MAG: valine--tRNA ligase [Candidatus Ryanbacteria bacterium CG10_big_fil_rev_8_21_14_0_10_43_42]|uniref:Valine--tRNA ligase n=1 Tax=Candidatus Ryanbacteria bacterium CG10_big_fil_rev_8_21_14_0_10_43_42 TaxID=1974864 RepID=A0A2M8KWF3_9BACT|nr:MAG: valine--tRNA ligase [Candidatus Ryanbacteria bacterium CG10_big_fil_rev_8_21_14_0_10_43_42]